MAENLVFWVSSPKTSETLQTELAVAAGYYMSVPAVSKEVYIYILHAVDQ